MTSRHDIYFQQATAEVYEPPVLRRNPEGRRHQGESRDNRQSNMAGMAALAGGSIHFQNGGSDGDYGNIMSVGEGYNNKRNNEEPLFGAVASLEEKWEFPRMQLSFREQLGEGVIGDVWRACAVDIGGRRGRSIVAVKMLAGETGHA